MRIAVMIIGLTLASSGCSGVYENTFSSTASIDPDERPTENDTYLYGRFTLNEGDSMYMAFIIRCQDGKTYTIPFSKDTPVQVIRISPSTCSLREFVYGVLNAGIERKRAPRAILWDVEFSPGKAYYLGDIVVRGSRGGAHRSGSYTSIDFEWRVESATDEYSATTSRLTATFPSLAGVAKEKKLIGESPSSVSDEEVARQMKGCGDAFGTCRVSCGSTDGGPSCLKECMKRLDECRKLVPD